MILLIDNYDSFVYNLARYARQLGYETRVIRNDQITIEDIKTLSPEKIILSPGPCAPDQAGISIDTILNFANTLPILGVCLGHQAIGQAFGANIIKAKQPMHGKSSHITHHQQGVFKDIPSPLNVGRYHSLIIDKASLPSELMITAESLEGEIMAIRHKQYPTYGLQFHPESINTDHGYGILDNFLSTKV